MALQTVKRPCILRRLTHTHTQSILIDGDAQPKFYVKLSTNHLRNQLTKSQFKFTHFYIKTNENYFLLHCTFVLAISICRLIFFLLFFVLKSFRLQSEFSQLLRKKLEKSNNILFKFESEFIKGRKSVNVCV